jgi:hypothetical protein
VRRVLQRLADHVGDELACAVEAVRLINARNKSFDGVR